MLEGFGATITTAGAIFGSFMAAAWKADDAFSEEARTTLSRRLIRLQVDNLQQNWPAAFSAVFEHIFGKRHLSGKCVRRSVVAGLVLVLAVLSCVLVWGIEETKSVFEPLAEMVAYLYGSPLFWVIVGVYVIFFYIALLKIRHILYWMIGRPSRTTNALGTVAIASLSLDFNLLVG